MRIYWYLGLRGPVWYDQRLGREAKR